MHGLEGKVLDEGGPSHTTVVAVWSARGHPHRRKWKRRCVGWDDRSEARGVVCTQSAMARAIGGAAAAGWATSHGVERRSAGEEMHLLDSTFRCRCTSEGARHLFTPQMENVTMFRFHIVNMFLHKRVQLSY